MDKSVKASVTRATPLRNLLIAALSVIMVMAVGFAIYSVDDPFAFAGDGQGGHSGSAGGGDAVTSGLHVVRLWFDDTEHIAETKDDSHPWGQPYQGLGMDSVRWFNDRLLDMVGSHWNTNSGIHYNYDSGDKPNRQFKDIGEKALEKAAADANRRLDLEPGMDGYLTKDDARIVGAAFIYSWTGNGIAGAYWAHPGDNSEVKAWDLLDRPGTDPVGNYNSVSQGGLGPSGGAWDTRRFEHSGAEPSTDDPKKWRNWVYETYYEYQEDTYPDGYNCWCVLWAVAGDEPSEAPGEVSLVKTSSDPSISGEWTGTSGSGENRTDSSNFKNGYTPEGIVYEVYDSPTSTAASHWKGAFILDKNGRGWCVNETSKSDTYTKGTGKANRKYLELTRTGNPEKDKYYVREKTILSDWNGNGRAGQNVQVSGFKHNDTVYEIAFAKGEKYEYKKGTEWKVYAEEEIVLKKGEYYDPCVIDKPMTLKLRIGKLAGKYDGKDITSGNNCYDLTGTEFEVCKNKNFPTNNSDYPIYTLVTNASGVAQWKDPEDGTLKNYVRLEQGLGTYYIRESKAPHEGYEPKAEKKPYEWDGNNAYTASAKYTATVTFDSFYPDSETDKSVSFTDKPIPDPFHFNLQKLDKFAGMKQTDGQGATTLAGAVYEVSFYKGVSTNPNDLKGSVIATKTPDARARFTTDANGLIVLGRDTPSSGTWPYHDSVANANYAPLGTITVKEITPPEGYLPDNNTYVLTVTDRDYTHDPAKLVRLYYTQAGVGKSDPRAWTVYSDDSIELPVLVNYPDDSVLMQETPKMGGIELRKCDNDALDTLRAKFVYQGGDLDYQGDASLKGAKFTIKLAPGMDPVYVELNEDGSSMPKDHGRMVSAGEIVTTITTDANGYAKTGNQDLPYATYLVQEAEPSPGYRLPEGWQRYVKITADGALHSTTTAGDSLLSTGAADEPVMRGGLDILKVDRDTKEPDPQGDATLKGAEFKIYNVSKHEVYVNGTWYPTYESTKNNTTKVLDYGYPDETLLNELAATDSDFKGQYYNRRNPIPYRYIGKYDIDTKTATPVATIYTGDDFHAKLSKSMLPYGTYVVFETKAPTGYLFDEDFKSGVSFTVDYNGEIEPFVSPVFIDNASWHQYWGDKTQP